jgi:MFS family permease
MSFFNGLKPKGYVLATLVISIGGFLNGSASILSLLNRILSTTRFDTGSIGAVTVMPHFLSTVGTLTPFMRGFTVSLIMLMGAVPSFLAGYLSDKYGRLSIGGLGATTFLLGVTLEAAANKLPMFLVGRAFAGIGEGFWLGCLTV